MSSKNGRAQKFCETLRGKKLQEMSQFNKAINTDQIDKASRLLESIGELSAIEEVVCVPPELRRRAL